MIESSCSPGRQPWAWPLAVLVGLAAFALSCCFVAPLTASWSLGLEFAAMASDPFAWHGSFPHRLLGPLVAWLLGLGGPHYWIFAHAMVVVFLSLVCLVALRRGCTAVGAAVLTATVAVTGAVEVYKGHVGYAEPIAFSLLLAGVLLTRRTGWFWVVHFLALLNHECVAFFWPWLLWVKARDVGGVKRGDLLGFAAAVGAYLVIRWSILAAATQPTLTANVYFGGLPNAATAGMWVLTAASVVIYFGVLPILLAWHAFAHGWRAAALPLLLVLGAIFAMCTFATDMPRFLGFLALPVVMAGVALLQRPGGVRWLAALGVVSAVAIVMQRRVVMLIVEALGQRMPEPLPALVIDLWWLFAVYGAVLVAMAAAGWWLARRGPRAAGPAGAVVADC